MSLYVMKTGDYDQCKSAFLIYGRAICTKNATAMAKGFLQRIAPDANVPVVRMRAMRDSVAKMEAGALWLSEDIVPYPIDCLAYAVWQAIASARSIDEQEEREMVQQVIPGWERARELLVTKAKPYSNQ